MMTVRVLSGLGQLTPAAVMASQRERFQTQARATRASDYSFRQYRRRGGGDRGRQAIIAEGLRLARRRRKLRESRAQQAQLPQLPDPMKISADKRRREDATRRASAMLTQMLAPARRPGAGQRTLRIPGIARKRTAVMPGAITRQQEIERSLQRSKFLVRQDWLKRVEAEVEARKAATLKRIAAEKKASLERRLPTTSTTALVTATALPMFQTPALTPALTTYVETPAQALRRQIARERLGI